MKRALADFDEINSLWVSKMPISGDEKLIRIEMMHEFEKLIKQLKDPPDKEKFDNGEWLLLMAMYALAYRDIYKKVFDDYYLKYVRLIKSNGTVSPFAKSWIEKHINAFMLYKHTADAKTTARTETNAMASLAQLDGYLQSGKTHKVWHTVLDGKERQDHRNADGQIKKLQEPFIIGGYEMMFPQDSSLGAPPEQIINCRCSMTAI